MANVHVTLPAVASVAVSLDAAQLSIGSTTSARATATDRDGALITPVHVVWSVLGRPDVASIDQGGVITAQAVGVATIVATVDSVSGQRDVTVVSGGGTQALRRAELPRVTLDFPYPAPTGQTIAVGPGDNLQAALNSAKRGDEIVLTAGATYSGNFMLPAKSGTAANGWITIRSDRMSQLPPIGTRVAASHAGLMAKLETPNTSAAIRTAAQASGWRLVGLEVTVAPAVTAVQYGLVWLGDGVAQKTLASVPSDLVLDRMYIHGQTTSSVQRCVALNSARTQISDSYIAECHAKGFDTQAIWGANGPGPYRIENNMLQGAGENVMFGGADPVIPNLVPSDIEIRRNFFYTPVSWKGVWTKKNLLEFKNAVRVLVEENVLDGSWLDAQTGWAIALKSVNQSGGCRWCRTTDVTIRRNLVRNAGAGMTLAGAPAAQPVDTAARRVVVSENVLDNLAAGPYTGDRRGFQLTSGLQDVVLERNVITGALQAAGFLDKNRPVINAQFMDNVWAFGSLGVFADGGNGSATLAVAAPGYTWTNNTFIGALSGTWPSGTTFVSNEGQSPLAAQIRARVAEATSGVAPGS